MNRPVAIASLVALLAACASYHKECYGNGVCRIEKNGVVTYDGPADKVAEIQAKEQAKKDAMAAADKAYADAPKRPATEPIRLVAVVGTANAELKPLVPAYQQMMGQALQGQGRIQLVPYDQVKGLVLGDLGLSSLMGKGNEAPTPAAVDEELTRRLRDGGAEVDVVLVVRLDTKKSSGFVSGGGGFGVAEVNNVDFQASLSSVYRLAELKKSEVGKSTDSLALAGVGKDGKASQGELKSKRNPEKDRPAIQAEAAWVKSTIETQIAADLPSLAAVAEIRSKSAPAGGSAAKDPAASDKTPEWLKRLIKNKQKQ